MTRHWGPTLAEQPDLANFSITEAALTGFRVVRGHPKAVLGWAALQFVLTGGTLLALVALAGPAVNQLATHGLPTDDAALAALMQQLVRSEPATLVLSLMIGSVLAAAMNRAVMNPQDDALAYLRLGRDELAQLGLKVILTLLWMAANLALGAVAGGFATLASTLGPVATNLAVFLVTLGAIGGLVYVSLRLSLASAATFANGRVDLRTSWTITRGHLSSILGAYCLALVLAALVFTLGIAIATLLTQALVSLIEPGGVWKPDFSSAVALIRPLPLTMVALISAAFGLATPLLSTPLAFIYQQMARPDGARGQRAAPKNDVYV